METVTQWSTWGSWPPWPDSVVSTWSQSRVSMKTLQSSLLLYQLLLPLTTRLWSRSRRGRRRTCPPTVKLSQLTAVLKLLPAVTCDNIINSVSLQQHCSMKLKKTMIFIHWSATSTFIYHQMQHFHNILEKSSVILKLLKANNSQYKKSQL